MDNVKILDCTLRDGGYYNNWDFSSSLSKNYLKVLAKTSVDFIEIGFRKPINNLGSGSSRLKKIGKFLISEDKYLKKINIPKNKKISVMIDLSDYIGNDGFRKLKKNFTNSKNSVVDIVRIACNFNDKNKIVKIVKYLKSKNYIICVNLMKFTILTNKQIISFLNIALKSGASYFYLADSFGNCSPKQIKKISRSFKKSKFDISCLGFHSHDNTGNALNNTITAINEGFGIIDTSIMGMGRGAGNLKLEDFLKYKNKITEKKKIDKFAKTFMYPLHSKYKWGKNKYYNYSAKHNIHPTFVQRFLEEEKFKKNHILKVLEFLKRNNATQYDMNIFDNLFLDTQKIKKIKNINNDKIALLCDNNSIKKLDIDKIKQKGYLLSSLNYIKFIDQKKLDIIFMSNAYRVFTEIERAINIKNINLVIPKYKMLKKLFKTKKEKIINYNILKDKNIKMNKEFCSFNKNLVLIYALSFCISNRFKEIVIYGLTKNVSNNEILDKIKLFVKSTRFKSKIYIK